jgi:hypothetical protein
MLRAPALALLVVVGAVAFAGDARADPRFDPKFSVTLTQPAPQVPSEMTLSWRLERGHQFSTVLMYLPLDWGVVPGDQIPVGTKVSSLDSSEIFGLINSACNQELALHVDLFNSSLDPSRTVSFGDTDQADVISTTDTSGYVYTYGYGEDDFAEDKDGNGIFDAVDRYPDFLTPTLGDVKPIARLAGVVANAGVPRLLQFLIFAPGSRVSWPDPTASQAIADRAQSGYPMLMVMQDFRSPDAAHRPYPITDYCAPVEMSLSWSPSDGSGGLLVNPQSGSYGFTVVAVSKRDADGDGFENSLDTCPFVTNAGDPTLVASGDADQDGIDVACDTNDDPITAGTNLDEDGDGYLNRQDICPLVRDTRALDWPGDQPDQDFDDIGDPCDLNLDSPDGEALVVTRTVEVVVGEASGSGGPPRVDACPLCYRADGSAPEGEGEGSGGQLAVALGLITVGAGAGAVLVGSGATYLIRRRRG